MPHARSFQSNTISSRQSAYKVRNLRRNPQAYVCVLPDGFFGRWIQIEGRADMTG
jgi:hypothetical protein